MIESIDPGADTIRLVFGEVVHVYEIGLGMGLGQGDNGDARDAVMVEVQVDALHMGDIARSPDSALIVPDGFTDWKSARQYVDSIVKYFDRPSFMAVLKCDSDDPDRISKYEAGLQAVGIDISTIRCEQ